MFKIKKQTKDRNYILKSLKKENWNFFDYALKIEDYLSPKENITGVPQNFISDIQYFILENIHFWK